MFTRSRLGFSSICNRVMALDDPWFLSEFCFHLMSESPHDKTNKMTFAASEDSDQPGSHVCIKKYSILLNVDSEDSDQTGRMPRLIWVFAGCTEHLVGFVIRWLIYRTNWYNLIKFWICIDIDKIYVGIAKHQFSLIYNRVMVLEWCQNFVSVQYLENKFMEFDQVLHMHRYWQHLGWNCYTSIFIN